MVLIIIIINNNNNKSITLRSECYLSDFFFVLHFYLPVKNHYFNLRGNPSVDLKPVAASCPQIHTTPRDTQTEEALRLPFVSVAEQNPSSQHK